MKYYPQAGVKELCGLFGKTRQAWYKQQRVRDDVVLKEAIIIKTVQDIRAAMPRIGSRKLLYLLTDTLQQHDIQIGRDKFFDLLADYGLLVRRRRRRKAYTTDSNHPFRKYPNLIKGIEPLSPDQLWVSDITYLRLAGRFGYLSLVTDAYSRKIVGYCLYPTLKTQGPLNALQMALIQCSKQKETILIHHSDRGLQYCCTDYTTLLYDNNISISMTEKGDPYENAIAERVNGILKEEFGLDKTFSSFEQASAAVTTAIQTYNYKRPHASCNYLTPAEAHLMQGLLTARWSKRKNKNEYERSVRV